MPLERVKKDVTQNSEVNTTRKELGKCQQR